MKTSANHSGTMRQSQDGESNCRSSNIVGQTCWRGAASGAACGDFPGAWEHNAVTATVSVQQSLGSRPTSTAPLSLRQSTQTPDITHHKCCSQRCCTAAWCIMCVFNSLLSLCISLIHTISQHLSHITGRAKETQVIDFCKVQK